MKNEIICPHCHKAFKIDDTAFAEIQKQVRDGEFNAELHARLDEAVKLAVAETKNEIKNDTAKKDAEIAELKAQKESAVRLAEESTKRELQATIAKRDTAIAELRIEKESLLSKIQAEKEAEITKLQSQLESVETHKDAEITRLLSKIETIEADKKSEVAQLQARMDTVGADMKLEIAGSIAKVEKERDELRSKIELLAAEKELAVSKAVNIVEKERDELVGKLEIKDHEQKALESSLKEKHETELRLKDEQIAQYKDFKSKQSVKLLGESLEQHCEIAFRQWQSAGAFKNVYFQKDNDASSGGKGDYVYRETDEFGNEILSIMFDMKNEADETVTKKKNEDYFKKLDKDRTEKKCHYAVLVSMLEADNELYAGITDVSYAYDKMYVVRPQFFVPIITLLRNSALDTLKLKAELMTVRNQNIDITNFENDLRAFQDDFMKNVKNSSSKFHEAMDGIDVTIKKLESIKEALRLSNKHLLTAGNKVETVSVKRLTKNNPTMAERFSELQEE